MGKVCPIDMNGPEWTTLVEMVGDYNHAFLIWESADPVTGKGAYEYPAEVLNKVASMKDNGMEMPTTVDPRVISRKERMDKAKDIVAKKIQRLQNRPDKSEYDFRTLADLERAFSDLNNLQTEFAIASFVDIAATMAAGSK